jgi:hypothetical protein
MKKEVKAKPKKNTVEVVKPKINYSVIDDVLEPNVFEHFIEVKAICATLSQNNKQETLINHRNVITFDTGLKMILPEGFRLNGKLVESLSSKGLYATDFILNENNSLKVVIINLGQLSQVAVQHKEIIAKVWIEPYCCFNLEKL